MTTARRFGVGLFWNYSGRTVEFITRFIFVSIVAKRLGPDGFGVFSFVISVFAVTSLIAGLGYEQSLNNFIPRYRQDKPRLRFILHRVAAVRFGILLLLLFVVVLIAPLLADRTSIGLSALVSVVPYLFFFSFFNLIAYFLVGLFVIQPVAWLRVAIQLINLTLGVLVIQMDLGVPALILVMGVSSVIALVGVAWFAREYLVGESTPVEMGPIHRFAWTLGLTNGLNYLLGRQSDVFMIAFLMGSAAAVGYYDLAATITLMLSTAAILGIEGVIHTAFSEIVELQPTKLGKAWQMMLKFTIIAAVPLMVFATVHANRVLEFYGVEYEPSIPLLRAYLFFMIIARLIGGGVNTTTLYSLGRERIPLYTRMVSGVFNLITGVIMILWMGPLGAVLATGTAGVLHIVETFYVLKLTDVKYPTGFVLKLIIASMFAVAGSYSMSLDGIIGFVLALVIFGLVFALSFLLLNPLSEDDKKVLVELLPQLKFVWGIDGS